MKTLDRITFDKLNIEDQIKYINNELKKGSTLTNTCKSIGIGRTTVRDRALKHSYTYDSNLNQYICTANAANKTTVSVPKSPIKNDMSTPIVSKEMTSRLIKLCNNYDKIIDVIEWFENDKDKTNVIEVVQGIKINLPEEKDTNFRKTLRVNDEVWKQFSKFCDCHKEFTQKDLLSQAILDYMENHK